MTRVNLENRMQSNSSQIKEHVSEDSIHTKCLEWALPSWLSGPGQEGVGTVSNGHGVSPGGVGNVLKLDSEDSRTTL